MMKKLELPPTIHIARFDEVPNEQNVRDAILAGESAKIVEGFTIRKDISEESKYDFYAEINVDNSRLWNLIESLLSFFPPKVSFIFGPADEDPLFGTYMDKEDVIDFLGLFTLELSQDGFLEYGFIYQDATMVQEIFIKKAKYIQFWGKDLEKFIGYNEIFSII